MTGGSETQQAVVATGNAHKLHEIRAILSGLRVSLVPMTELGLPSPVEDGDSFEENALIKARACRAGAGCGALADDSGLEVDALDARPGIFSARYAGPSASDEDNNAKLLAELVGIPEEARTARYVCAAAYVAGDGEEYVVRGVLEGHIVGEPRGSHGFGYDPYFVPRGGDGRTCAELDPAEKDAISHRGAAFRALRRRIEPLLGG